MWLLGTRLRSSSLQSKHLVVWDISPSSRGKNMVLVVIVFVVFFKILSCFCFQAHTWASSCLTEVTISDFTLTLHLKTSSNPWDYCMVLGAEGAGRTKVCWILVEISWWKVFHHNQISHQLSAFRQNAQPPLGVSASGSYSHACTISVQAKCLTIPGLLVLHNRNLCKRYLRQPYARALEGF